MNKKAKKESMIMISVVATVIIIGLLIFSFVVIDAGNVGVYNLFGVVDDQEYQPGLHFKNPLASVESMSIKTQEYTMTFTQGEGAVKGKDTISALTKEGLTVDLDITVLYKLSPAMASEIYKTIGIDYVGVIVRPQIRTIIREVVAKYEAKQLYSEDRQAVALEISTMLEPELLDRGVILERVLLRHIQLPAQLTDSIELKLVAEQEAERMEFILVKELQEAERKEIEAVGIKNATLIVQEGLSGSPEYLTYLWLQKLENHESVVYVMEGEMGLPIFKNIDS